MCRRMRFVFSEAVLAFFDGGEDWAGFVQIVYFLQKNQYTFQNDGRFVQISLTDERKHTIIEA